MYKFFALAFLLLVGGELLSPRSIRAQNDEISLSRGLFHYYMAACSAGQEIELTGELRNNLIDVLYGESGVDARDLIIRNVPAFMELLPEEDRIEGLRLYYDCLSDAFLNYKDSIDLKIDVVIDATPAPQASLNVPQLMHDCLEPVQVLEEDADQQDIDLAVNSARKGLASCYSLVQQQQANQEVYVQQLRQSIFLWYHVPSEPFPIRIAIQDYSNLSLSQDAGPREHFYKGYIRDLEQLVLDNASLDGQPRECPLTYPRYEETITRYLAKYATALLRYREARADLPEPGEPNAVSSSGELSSEEAYILIELGHWLINRDIRLDTANELFDIVLAHYSGTNSPIEYNALVGKGLVFYIGDSTGVSIRLFQSAIDLEVHDQVDRSDQIRVNLAGAYAKDRDYAKAANLYHEASLFETMPANQRFRVLMESAFAHLLEATLIAEESGNEQWAVVNYQNAKDRLGSAREVDPQRAGNDPMYQAFFGIAHFQSGIGSIDEAITYFNKALTLDPNNRIAQSYLALMNGVTTSNNVRNVLRDTSFFFTPIPHDAGADPVLDIYHGLFYCRVPDQRI